MVMWVVSGRSALIRRCGGTFPSRGRLGALYIQFSVRRLRRETHAVRHIEAQRHAAEHIQRVQGGAGADYLAVVTVSLSLCVAIPAAYCFSRRRFPGRRPILKCLVLLNSFPAVLSMFAVYRLLRPMGLINHRTGLILIYTGTMAVFSLWNIKGYFDTVPVEIEEAARMDGANPLQVVTRIVLPLAKPSIVVTALMVLIYVWNEYIYATNTSVRICFASSQSLS